MYLYEKGGNRKRDGKEGEEMRGIGDGILYDKEEVG